MIKIIDGVPYDVHGAYKAEVVGVEYDDKNYRHLLKRVLHQPAINIPKCTIPGYIRKAIKFAPRDVNDNKRVATEDEISILDPYFN